jgi:hypothetical protein
MDPRSLRRWLSVSLFVSALLTGTAQATVYVVNSSDDTIAVDGSVTLREALAAASQNAIVGDAAAGTVGLDTITFNIPGSGVHTIAVGSSLPVISDPVLLDGWSQPGAIPGTPLIALQGDPSVVNMLEIITSGGGSTIRGLAIDGFLTAIAINSSSNNTVQGNYIGVGSTGLLFTSDPVSGNAGVSAIASNGSTGSNNLIGGTGPGERNVIATAGPAVTVGIAFDGIADGNRVIGNRLNTNAAGTALLAADDSSSVIVAGGTNTHIGGSTGTSPGGACTGGCNLAGAAIQVIGMPGDGAVIESNFVGTDVTGRVPLAGAGSSGVYVFASGQGFGGSILIGGVTPAARNVIVGRGRPAIWMPDGGGASAHVTIQGNYVGIDTTGTRSLGGEEGIELSEAVGVIIGGTTPGSGNVLSGQSIYNVSINESSGTIVQGNIIGPAADGVTALDVRANRGVSVEGPSTSNVIGALAPGGPGGNIIAYASTGVRVEDPAVRATIFGNSMFEISRLGIDLNRDGISANDACDADARANLTQNFPVLTVAAGPSGTFTISGTLNSAPNATYQLEFFATPAGTTGPARTPIGSTTVSTNSSCFAVFTFVATQPTGTSFTATATDVAGNTSELSAASAVALDLPTLSPITLLLMTLALAVVAALAMHRT